MINNGMKFKEYAVIKLILIADFVKEPMSGIQFKSTAVKPLISNVKIVLEQKCGI